MQPTRMSAVLVALGLAACAGRTRLSQPRPPIEGSTEKPAPGTAESTAENVGQATGEAAVLQVRDAPELGRFLTDARGRTVYLFLADEHNGQRSACFDECATAWPPVLTEGRPVAGSGVDEHLLGTLDRGDGTTQVSYRGWPLYYFAKDQAPGDTTGEGVQGFGAEWYVVAPDGAPVRPGQAAR
jgi:predicted lipoprotein with Yx(FWY)xxD motif